MKYILNRIIALTLLVFVVSCTDLKEEPVGALAPEFFFQTPKDVETGIFGAYGLAASETYYGRKLSLSLLLRDDMADIGDRKTPGRRQQVNDFNMDSNNGMIVEFWPRSYQIIAAANVALKGIDNVTAEEDVLNALRAEARFIRSFSYYHLVRLFGEIPLLEEPVSDFEAIEAAKVMSKSSVSDVYNLIKEDLEFGKQWLPDAYSNGVRTRPTKATAAAYLASVHLTLGEFQEAYDEANWVIDNESRFGLGLEADFRDLFDATKQNGMREVLFAFDFLGLNSGGYNTNVDYLGSVTGPRAVSNGDVVEGWSVAVPTMAVFDTWDSRDYRKEVSFIDSGYVAGVWSGYDQFAPNHGSARPHIAKYFENPGVSNSSASISDANVHCMRYAEVLLIAAEALNEVSGPTAEAKGYVDRVRERARNWAGTMTDFPANVDAGVSAKEAFRDLVLEERRLELAFELKRWYDIKRRQLGDEVFKGPNSLEPHSNFDASRDYLFPIPGDEIDRNENLKPQNPGY
jgi:hypothetical protein